MTEQPPGSTLLLLDCSYLCYRAWFTTGGLKHEGTATGVAYGFLQTVESLTELFGATVCVFAWDYRGPGKRSEFYPEYKANRRQQLSEDEERELQIFRDQVQRLEKEIVPALGYRNSISIRGYEADDIIAKYAEDLGSNDSAVIVSGDADLWQCLTQRVSFYNPTKKELLTAKKFQEIWGIRPFQWATVKALTGCKTDNVEGIRGVGDKGAVAWIRGELKTDSKKCLNIDHNLDVMTRNMPLVMLPMQGIEVPELLPDETTDRKRSEVMATLGFSERRPKAIRPGGFDI